MTIAETYYNNYENNRYVYDEDNDIWYMYNKYNILIEKKSTERFTKWYIKYIYKTIFRGKNKLKIPDNVNGEEYEIKKTVY